jgi:hypothetical protein
MASLDWFWVKGNLHTHSTESDGDFTPTEVARWYGEHGYQFLAITDHDTFIDPASVEYDGLLLIPGEELAVEISGKPIHLNALGLTSELKAKGGHTKTEAIEANIDLIRATGAIPMVNHPNWHYAFDHRDLLPIDKPYLMEILNASGCQDEGDPAHIPTEQIWDILLSAGRSVIATTTDDAHHYKDFAPEKYNPGRAWVVARVRELTVQDVLKALDCGDFYCSTGVEMENVTFDGETLQVVVNADAGTDYRIRFIGRHGQILDEFDGSAAKYAVRDDGGYIRAKVISSDGKVAWTQAFRVGVS